MRKPKCLQITKIGTYTCAVRHFDSTTYVHSSMKTSKNKIVDMIDTKLDLLRLFLPFEDT